MKVCPKCARSFAEGFHFCPQDATELVNYDLRADLKARGELQFLLQEDTLWMRLRRELSAAAIEFKHNPRFFFAGLIRGEGSPRRRKRLLQTGVASAVIVYTTMMMTGLLLGLFTSQVQPSEASKLRPRTTSDPPTFIVPVFLTKPEVAQSTAKPNQGHLGGSLQQPRRAHGGGGGGDHAPASRGAAPTALLAQQVMKPDLELPKIEHPTWIVTPTIYADPKSFLKMTGPAGMRNGQTEIPSLGNGPGTGVGPGKGSGYGPGENGGVGGGQFAPSGGPTNGTGNDIYVSSGNLRPTILHRERARYTEQARQNKIQGTVILSLVFGADGLIHDIRVVHSQPDGLTEEAIKAAQQIRFNPALREGKPVSVRSRIEYNFTLY